MAGKPTVRNPIVIVPTYNERQNISRLIPELRESVPQSAILVVDDNSPDGTGTVVKEFMQSDSKVSLVTRPEKKGLGRAYLEGFQWALERGHDAVVEMDADFSHRPTDVARLLETLAAHDVAIGCRYMKGGATPGWSLRRRWISQGGNIYARCILGINYRDLTGGFTAWRSEVLRAINLADVQSKGYAFQVELKYRAHLKGFTMKEIPIIFQERADGTSKMSANIVREAVLRVPQLRKLRAELR